MVDKKVLTVCEACQELGVCRNTMKKYLEGGYLKYFKLPSGQIRVFQESIEEIMRLLPED